MRSRIVFASAAVIAAITLYEGGKDSSGGSRVYADKLAGGLPTVCGGITRWTYKERPIVVGEYWTAEECHKAESYVITETQKVLLQCMPNAPQGVFDAVTSLAHNVGVNKVCKDARAVRLINAGQLAAGCRAIAWGANGKPVWATADGVFYSGLHKRRLKEMNDCLQGILN